MLLSSIRTPLQERRHVQFACRSRLRSCEKTEEFLKTRPDSSSNREIREILIEISAQDMFLLAKTLRISSKKAGQPRYDVSQPYARAGSACPSLRWNISKKSCARLGMQSAGRTLQLGRRSASLTRDLRCMVTATALAGWHAPRKPSMQPSVATAQPRSPR